MNNRARFSQNFLRDADYVKGLVRQSDITATDSVLEIGPGNGVITEALAEQAKEIIAVEIDSSLRGPLLDAIRHLPTVTVKFTDFLTYPLPQTPYKVFANIPFSITAEILQRFWTARQTPDSAYFIVQKEVGDKFLGQPISTESSITFQPWFDIQVLAQIPRHQFIPEPTVDAVLLAMHPAQYPRLDVAHKTDFAQFVSYGFRAWKDNLKVAYKNVFSYKQWKRLAGTNRFPLKARPSELNVAQWVQLYKFYDTQLPPEKKREIFE